MCLSGSGIDATLNHQLPILHGRDAADSIVDDYDAASWAEQLDTRVFFWPERRGREFAVSIARYVPLKVLWLDTGRLLETCSDRLHLSPINSGNFRQGGAKARRGDWLYVPVTRGMPAFRHNRRRRGLVSSTDQVKELSLAGGLDHETLAYCRSGIEAPG